MTYKFLYSIDLSEKEIIENSKKELVKLFEEKLEFAKKDSKKIINKAIKFYLVRKRVTGVI